jgi:hypothetical protein
MLVTGASSRGRTIPKTHLNGALYGIAASRVAHRALLFRAARYEVRTYSLNLWFAGFVSEFPTRRLYASVRVRRGFPSASLSWLKSSSPRNENNGDLS